MFKFAWIYCIQHRCKSNTFRVFMYFVVDNCFSGIQVFNLYWTNEEFHLNSYKYHYSDVIMGAIASQITSITIVYSTIYSSVDQRKHQSSASLAFVQGIHWWPVNFPHKWPVTRKMFPFDDVIIISHTPWIYSKHNHNQTIHNKTLCTFYNAILYADFWLSKYLLTDIDYHLIVNNLLKNTENHINPNIIGMS